MERAPILERIKSAIYDAVALATGPERENSADYEGEAEMADEKQLKELSANVEAMQKSIGDGFKDLATTFSEALTNALKPLNENLENIQNERKAAEDAERSKLVNSIVKSGLMAEEETNGMPMASLKALANKTKPGKSYGIANGADPQGDEDEFKDYNLNSHMDKEGK